MTFAEGSGGVTLRDTDATNGEHRRLVLALLPERDLFPGVTWPWADLDAQVREAATDEESPYSFGHMFAQQVCVEVRMTCAGVFVAADEAVLFACDARRLGEEPDFERIEQAMTVCRAVDALPSPFQEAVRRFFLEDQSYRMISEALDISAGTVASRISRGLAMLREVLEADHEAARA